MRVDTARVTVGRNQKSDEKDHAVGMPDLERRTGHVIVAGGETEADLLNARDDHVRQGSERIDTDIGRHCMTQRAKQNKQPRNPKI